MIRSSLSLPRLRSRSYFPNRSFVIILIPMFLIVSSSVYPAIISAIQNKEMVIIAEAVAQLEGDNSSRLKKLNANTSSSNYHSTMILPTSPTPISESRAANNEDLSNLSLPGSASPSSNQEFTTQAALSSAAARQTNNIVNTKAYYDIVFTTPTGGAIKRIDMVFPTGTDLSGVRLLETEGIGSGGPGVTGNTLTYFVSSPVAKVPAGTQIRLEFANIGNPAAPDAGYKVSITTRDAAGTIIDGPTDTFTYLMKQIGNSDIADGAVTTEKIADGTLGTSDLADNAVTTAKLSEDPVHVIWTELALNFEVFYRSNAVAGFESPTVNLSDNPLTASGSFGHSVAASSNNVYVVWSEDPDGGFTEIEEILFRRSTDGGATFGNTVNLSNNAGVSFVPSIAVSGNNIYVVWVDTTTNGDIPKIFYRISTDGGVSFGSTLILSGDAGFQPSIAVSGNNVYVVWHDVDLEIKYRRSSDAGVSFGSTINLSNNTGESHNPSIAVFGNNIHVAWNDNSTGNYEILYRRSTDSGATFGSVLNLSNNAESSRIPSIVASGNSVYVVWHDGMIASVNEILYRKSIDSGVTFGSTINLSNNPEASSNPSIAISGSNVYVIWQDRSLGNNEIFYRQSTDGGATFGRILNLSNSDDSSTIPKIAVS